MRIRLHPLFDAETGGAGAGGTTPTAPAASDPTAAFQNLLARSSDAAALARQLFEENFRYRTELREAQRQVPAQGAVVLTPEQAASWQSYQQLGAPDAVQQTIAAHKTLQRDLELRDVAAATGFQIEVLRTLASDLAFEVRDEAKDGKAVKVVYVKGADGKDIPIEQHAQTAWAAFLPALRPAQQGQVGAPTTGATNPVGSHGATPPTKLDPKHPPTLSSITWKT